MLVFMQCKTHRLFVIAWVMENSCFVRASRLHSTPKHQMLYDTIEIKERKKNMYAISVVTAELLWIGEGLLQTHNCCNALNSNESDDKYLTTNLTSKARWEQTNSDTGSNAIDNCTMSRVGELVHHKRDFRKFRNH